MAEEGAKHVDMSFGVNARFVPVHQGTDSESVAEVMKSGTATIRKASQTYLARQFDEGPTGHTVGHR